MTIAVVAAAARQPSAWVRAKSADPFTAPLIQPNYLAGRERPPTCCWAGMKLARRLLHSPAAQQILRRPRGISPALRRSPDEDPDDGGQATRHDDLPSHGHLPAWRPDTDPNGGGRRPAPRCGGARGTAACVDASIMPTMPSANLNASVLMIAEKAADLIRGPRAAARSDNVEGMMRFPVPPDGAARRPGSISGSWGLEMVPVEQSGGTADLRHDAGILRVLRRACPPTRASITASLAVGLLWGLFAGRPRREGVLPRLHHCGGRLWRPDRQDDHPVCADPAPRSSPCSWLPSCAPPTRAVDPVSETTEPAVDHHLAAGAGRAGRRSMRWNSPAAISPLTRLQQLVEASRRARH